MKLSIPFLNKKSDTDYLLIILLNQERVNIAIIKKSTGTSTQIVGRHTEYFTKKFEELTHEEWISILDRCIGRAEEALPLDVITRQAVFGLPTTWIDEKQINTNYLEILKKAASELGIKPIGFIDLTEASVHILKKQEGMPVSAVFVSLGKQFISVSVIKGGKILRSKQTDLIDLPDKSIDSILQTFVEIHVLPTRIIVLSDNTKEDLAASLVRYSWTKHLAFLHPPQITILSDDFDTKAISYAAISQLGLTGLDLLEDTKKDIKNYESNTANTSDEKNDTDIEENEELKKDTNEDDTNSLDQFGFLQDEDVLEKETINKPSIITKRIESDNISSEHIPLSDFQIENKSINNSDITSGSGSKAVKPRNFNLILKNTIHSIRNTDKSKKPFLIIGVVLFMLIALSILYYQFAKITVTIYVEPEFQEQEENITFAVNGLTDLASSTIKAGNNSVTVSGQTSTAATGKKESGTNAKGSITIYNSEKSKIKLPKGTSVSSSNNLEFKLDNDTEIASASGDIFSGTKPGTTKASVTAAKIGNEYNLPSDTKFIFSSNSNLAAKNDEAFTGGTKKDILVVSSDDIEKLSEELPKKLESEAKKELESKIPKETTILSVNSDFKPSKTDFSAYTDQEAKSISLDSSVNFQAVYYDNKDLFNFAKNLIEEKYNKELKVSNQEITNTISDITIDSDDSISATLTIKALLLPDIDTEDILKLDIGSSDQILKSLQAYPQVKNVSITYMPPLGPINSILPKNTKNIEVKINTEDE